MHTFKYIEPAAYDQTDHALMERLELVDRALILQTPLPSDIYSTHELLAMDEPQLRIVLDKLREQTPAPAPASPRKRAERPVAYVDPALPDRPAWRPPHARPQLPAWATEQAAKAPRLVTRKIAPEDRPPRYRAQLWHNGYVVHLGMYNTLEARDAAVAQAKARRDIGLPIKGA